MNIPDREFWQLVNAVGVHIDIVMRDLAEMRTAVDRYLTEAFEAKKALEAEEKVLYREEES